MPLLAFFTDYLAACEQVSCPAPLRFSASLQDDARHVDELWRRSQVAGLRRVRLDEVTGALARAGEAATASAALHPDYVEEMLRVAGQLGKRGQREEQLRWLERRPGPAPPVGPGARGARQDACPRDAGAAGGPCRHRAPPRDGREPRAR